MNAAEFAEVFSGRDEVEDPLHELLTGSGLGEVTGGGSGSGVVVLDLEIEGEEITPTILHAIRQLLREIGVPKSTFIRRPRPTINVYPVYDDVHSK